MEESALNITIIGAGRVGAAVGSGWAGAGNKVTFGVRDPNAEKVAIVVAVCGHGTCAKPVGESAGDADAVFLATPWMERSALSDSWAISRERS